MGPLASMFGHLYDQYRPQRVDALRRGLSADDNMGPIILDPQHPSINLDPVPFMWGPELTAPAPAGYRPTEDVGPSPPIGRPSLAEMYRR
jgi:hypothetical protein